MSDEPKLQIAEHTSVEHVIALEEEPGARRIIARCSQGSDAARIVEALTALATRDEQLQQQAKWIILKDGYVRKLKEKVERQRVHLREKDALLHERKQRIQYLSPYCYALHHRHNGYRRDVRAEVPTIKEPETPEQALDELIEEATDLGKLEAEAYKDLQIAELQGYKQHSDAVFALAAGLGHFPASSQAPTSYIAKRIEELKAENERLKQPRTCGECSLFSAPCNWDSELERDRQPVVIQPASEGKVVALAAQPQPAEDAEKKEG